MNVELPKTRPYGAVFIVGDRLIVDDPLSDPSVQTIGSIVVKAAFRLSATGGADTHVMTPDFDPAASALMVADSLGADGMAVTREADLAPYKPLTDIVVEGFLGHTGPTDEQVQVDGTVWLTRREGSITSEPLSLADRNLHLFGYQPRSEDPRAGEAGNPLSDPVPDPLEPDDFPLRTTTLLGAIVGYENGFLNFHRRGGGFDASAAIAEGLSDGQRVTVRRAGADAFSVTLALPNLTALYRTWCGDGPDKAPYWTRKRLGAMRVDTLILRPDAGSAEVIWRAVWPWHDEPIGSYRAVRVTEEGV